MFKSGPGLKFDHNTNYFWLFEYLYLCSNPNPLYGRISTPFGRISNPFGQISTLLVVEFQPTLIKFKPLLLNYFNENYLVRVIAHVRYQPTSPNPRPQVPQVTHSHPHRRPLVLAETQVSRLCFLGKKPPEKIAHI